MIPFKAAKYSAVLLILICIQKSLQKEAEIGSRKSDFRLDSFRDGLVYPKTRSSSPSKYIQDVGADSRRARIDSRDIRTDFREIMDVSSARNSRRQDIRERRSDELRSNRQDTDFSKWSRFDSRNLDIERSRRITADTRRNDINMRTFQVRDNRDHMQSSRVSQGIRREKQRLIRDTTQRTDLSDESRRNDRLFSQRNDASSERREPGADLNARRVEVRFNKEAARRQNHRVLARDARNMMERSRDFPSRAETRLVSAAESLRENRRIFARKNSSVRRSERNLIRESPEIGRRISSERNKVRDAVRDDTRSTRYSQLFDRRVRDNRQSRRDVSFERRDIPQNVNDERTLQRTVTRRDVPAAQNTRRLSDARRIESTRGGACDTRQEVTSDRRVRDNTQSRRDVSFERRDTSQNNQDKRTAPLQRITITRRDVSAAQNTRRLSDARRFESTRDDACDTRQEVASDRRVRDNTQSRRDVSFDRRDISQNDQDERSASLRRTVRRRDVFDAQNTRSRVSDGRRIESTRDGASGNNQNSRDEALERQSSKRNHVAETRDSSSRTAASQRSTSERRDLTDSDAGQRTSFSSRKILNSLPINVYRGDQPIKEFSNIRHSDSLLDSMKTGKFNIVRSTIEAVAIFWLAGLVSGANSKSALRSFGKWWQPCKLN